MSVQDLTNTTWIIHDTPQQDTSLEFEEYSISFISNESNYTILRLTNDFMEYVDIEYNYTKVWNGFTAYPNAGSWTNAAYKTINITGGTDVTNANLITWLEANATLQGGSLPSVDFDLTTLHLAVGPHSLTVLARADGYRDSDPTAVISYTVYGQVDTPIATLISGYDFAWTAVAHAASYNLYVDDSLSQTGISPSHFDLRTLNLSAGLYSVTVKAIGEQYYHDAMSNAVSYYVLAAPTNLSVSDLTASFSRVNNADSYGLYSDGTLIGTYTPADLSTTPVVVDLTTLTDWGNVTLGTHTLTVKAQRSGAMDSPASSGVTFLNALQLDPPQHVTAADTVVSFDEVEHAEQYEVFIDGNSAGTLNGPVNAPERNDIEVQSNMTVGVKSSFVEDAEAYEYILDGESIGTAPLAFAVYAFPAAYSGSGSNCAVYAKINSDTVSTTDYTWYVESNGTMHGSANVDNVTKVAIMSTVAQGNTMAILGLDGNITQSLTPVVIKLHGDQSLALIYRQE